MAERIGGASVIYDRALRRHTEAEHKGDEGGFSASGSSDNGNLLPGSDMERNIAYRRLRRTLIFEGNAVKNNVAGKFGILRRDFVIDAFGAQNLADAVGGDLCLGRRDENESRGHNAVHNQRDVLNYSENIAGADGVFAGFHSYSAQIRDNYNRKVEQKKRKGRDYSHTHVGTDNVFSHRLYGFDHSPVFFFLVAEGADNAYSVEPFTHNVVLFVNVNVGVPPERFYFLSDKTDDGEHNRNKT